MFEEALASLRAWWDTVPTGFAFLLLLAFAVAATGLLRDGGRHPADDSRGDGEGSVGGPSG